MPGEMSADLASAYDAQYSDASSEWRELGARYKALNLVAVCRGHAFRRVLDCGAGEGSVLRWLDREGVWPELHAVEVSESALAQIEKRRPARLREAKKFDGYAIPYPDRHFDLAYCSHVVEHVEHPRLLLRELARVSAFQAFEIPLEYSAGVDRRVAEFLGYGHINVYTPSLFRFLLKSEGYEVLAEKLSYSAPEVLRYNWYRNLKLKPSLKREAFLRLAPLWRSLRRALRGAAWEEEFGAAAYTCLARAGERPRILQGGIANLR